MTDLAQWPPDLDAHGQPVPDIGSYVTARRLSDGLIRHGMVVDNRAGVFLDGPAGRHVLTAVLWEFTVHSPVIQPIPLQAVQEAVRHIPLTDDDAALLLAEITRAGKDQAA